MSVPAWRRNGSKLDAEYEAIKLRRIIMQMIMRSFGLKTKYYKPLVSKGMKKRHPEMKRFFERIEEYQRVMEETITLQEYDEWFVEKVRDTLYDYSRDLIKHISGANKVKCTFACDFDLRITTQDKAIQDLENINQEINFVEEEFEIDLNKYMGYADQFILVRKLLYRWKRSTVKAYNEYLEDVYSLDIEFVYKVK